MSKRKQSVKKERISRDTRGQSDGIVGVVITVVVVAVVALVGILIVSSLVTGGIGPSGSDVAYEPVAGETEVLDSQIEERPAVFEVSLTTEQAVRLNGESDGTRSYIEFSDGGEVVTNGGNWTLMASGRLDPAANGQATYNLLAVDNETVTLAYSNGGWEATYLKGNDSAQARVSATEPTTFTSLGVRYNNSTDELTLTRNGNVSNRTTLDTTSETRPLQQDWFGAVDEYRFFDVALADSELDRLAAEPVAGTTVNTTARYRLDEGSSNTSAADYSSGTATLVSGTWTTGLANPIEDKVDYEVTFDPLAVTTFADGLADGAPILYVNWDSGLNAQVATIVNGFSSAVSLIPILLIALLAGVLITTTARLRQ